MYASEFAVINETFDSTRWHVMVQDASEVDGGPPHQCSEPGGDGVKMQRLLLKNDALEVTGQKKKGMQLTSSHFE